MPSLHELLATCEEDTRRLVGKGAANRLAAWRSYKSEEGLIAFIQRTIRVRDNQANGFLIAANGGISLEAIVAIHKPSMFVEEDILIAKTTLGIA